MRIDALRSIGTSAVLLATFAAGLILPAGGCSKSEQGSNAATEPKFEVADDAPAGDSEGAGSAAAMAGGSAAATPGNAGPGPKSPLQPPTIPIDQLEKITVPDGSPEDLMKFLEQLRQRAAALGMQAQATGTPPAALPSLLEAMLQAADKVLAANPEIKIRKQAIDYKAGALSQLSLLAPDKQWDQQIRTFAGSLAADADPAVALEGKCILLGIRINDLVQQRSQDVEGTVAQIKALIADQARDGSVLDVTQQAVMALRAIGREDEAREAFELIAAAFKDHPDPQLAAESANMTEQLLMLDARLEAKVRDIGQQRDGAEEKFQAALDTVLQRPNPGPIVLQNLLDCVGYLEQMGRYDLAKSVCQRVELAYQDHRDATLRDGAKQAVDRAMRRLNLPGKPLAVEGTRLDGSAFDFGPYQGKVVLVVFWRAMSPRCQQELLNLKNSYSKYHDKGFEVVGVNLDPDPAAVSQFLTQGEIPWTTITSNKMVEACGVQLIPFLVLLDQQGTVIDMYVQARTLDEKLAALLGPVGPATPSTPVSPKPAGGQSSRMRPRVQRDAASSLVLVSPATATDTPTGTLPAEAPTATATRPADPLPPGDEQEELPREDANANPYLAPPGLTPAQLVEFLFTMEDKPQSIRRRPGFSEALVDAADRILAGPAEERLQLIAIDTKFSTLHESACLGSEAADRQLQAFAEQMHDDQRPAVMRRVEFFVLERRALDADQLDIGEVPGLLSDLKQFVESKDKLTQEHLRLASATVHAINRLDDEKEREKYFAEFGRLFAESDNRQLSRYGKKLVGEGKGQLADLIGKPLELSGVTAFGTQFDWSSYRGRIVLVDFWATWCGPCLQELPRLQALSKKLADGPFDIVAASLDDDLEALAKYLEDNKVAWPNLVGPEARELADKYGVRGIPTMILVDKTGIVVGVGHKVAQLESQIQQLMATE